MATDLVLFGTPANNVLLLDQARLLALGRKLGADAGRAPGKLLHALAQNRRLGSEDHQARAIDRLFIADQTRHGGIIAPRRQFRRNRHVWLVIEFRLVAGEKGRAISGIKRINEGAEAGGADPFDDGGGMDLRLGR